MNRARWGLTVAVLAALTLVGGLMAAPRLVVAQDAATPMAGEMEHNHPAHIHTGTCDAVGEVVFPLNNIVSGDDMSSPEADMGAMASPESGMTDHEDYVAESTTTITATFDDLAAAEHVINIHESEENIGNYITCGAITGTATDGELTLALDAMNDSGWQGEAHLVDNGDGTIDVTVELWAAEMEDMGSPVASPES